MYAAPLPLVAPSSPLRRPFVVSSREEHSSSNNIYVNHEDDCETKTGGSTNLRVGLFIHCFSFFHPPENVRCKTLSRPCATSSTFYFLRRLICDVLNSNKTSILMRFFFNFTSSFNQTLTTTFRFLLSKLAIPIFIAMIILCLTLKILPKIVI